MILIISRDEDFSAVVAEQVKEELGLACRTVATVTEAKALPEGAVMLAVSTEDMSAGKPSYPLVSCVPPVRLQGLLAGIRNTLAAAETLLEFGDYTLSTLQKQVVQRATGKQTELTDKETQLLQAIVKAGKNGVSKESLLKDLWGMDAEMNTHTLETHIYRLRTKLRELGEGLAIAASDSGYKLDMK